MPNEKKDAPLVEPQVVDASTPDAYVIKGLLADVKLLKSELYRIENTLHARISVLDQKLASPIGTYAPKLPSVGDTMGDTEVVHVSPGVPGISGPSIVTRGKD